MARRAVWMGIPKSMKPASPGSPATRSVSEPAVRIPVQVLFLKRRQTGHRHTSRTGRRSVQRPDLTAPPSENAGSPAAEAVFSTTACQRNVPASPSRIQVAPTVGLPRLSRSRWARWSDPNPVDRCAMPGTANPAGRPVRGASLQGGCKENGRCRSGSRRSARHRPDRSRIRQGAAGIRTWAAMHPGPASGFSKPGRRHRASGGRLGTKGATPGHLIATRTMTAHRISVREWTRMAASTARGEGRARPATSRRFGRSTRARDCRGRAVRPTRPASSIAATWRSGAPARCRWACAPHPIGEVKVTAGHRRRHPLAPPAALSPSRIVSAFAPMSSSVRRAFAIPSDV